MDYSNTLEMPEAGLDDLANMKSKTEAGIRCSTSVSDRQLSVLEKWGPSVDFWEQMESIFFLIC